MTRTAVGGVTVASGIAPDATGGNSGNGASGLASGIGGGRVLVPASPFLGMILTAVGGATVASGIVPDVTGGNSADGASGFAPGVGGGTVLLSGSGLLGIIRTVVRAVEIASGIALDVTGGNSAGGASGSAPGVGGGTVLLSGSGFLAGDLSKEEKGDVLAKEGFFQEIDAAGDEGAGVGKSKTGKTLMLAAFFLARDFTTSGIGIRTVSC
jgi:hypothetical protein